MDERNYIELGALVLVFAALLIWKLITRHRVKKMDGMKGENNGTPNGSIVGKFGDSKKN